MHHPLITLNQDISLINRNLKLDLLCNSTIGSNDDLVDFERSLDGVGLVVDPFELFEGTSLRLDTVRVSTVAQNSEVKEGKNIPEEVPHKRFDDIPSNKDKDVSVSGIIRMRYRIVKSEDNLPDVSKSIRTGERVDESEGADNDTTGSETFGSSGVFE